MGISLRDEKGQGIVEYVLVLVVSVSIILGGLYQLNQAFKVWANNYFGNYLACLLETGELPTISGNPGDSGICNQFFKPFSLADGRPLRERTNTGETQASQGSGGSTRDNRRGGGGGGGGGYGSYTGGHFGRGSSGGGSGPRTPLKGGKKDESTYTGSTGVASYGGNYGALNRRLDTSPKIRLDTRFAFDDRRESQRERKIAGVTAKAPEASGRKQALHVRKQDAKKDGEDAPSSSFTIANFLRWLIIAAIIIAIIVFLGGQGLQIGKSMDG